MLTLRIELKSGLCAGSGAGRPGFVDREVCFDRLGLPFIPGRSLKGLLRDAYRGLPPVVLTGLPRECDIFGGTGDIASGPIQVGNARLKSHPELSAWLDQVYADGKLRATIRREEVIGHFSEIRRQTAMDRESGAPLQDTLRATRVVRPGEDMVMEAGIEGLESGHRSAVALAAAALQEMGTARTRGLGEVKCSLWDGGTNLTAGAIEKLRSGDLDFSKPGTHAATGTVAAEGATPGYRLGFTLTLCEGALFPAFDSDANTVLSESFVPGSVLRGLLAWRWIESHGDGKPFDRLFLSGTRFLAAAPKALQGRRAIPVPVSVRESKDRAGAYFDLTRRRPLEPVRRVPGWIEGPAATGTKFVGVRTELHYHNQRARDVRIGRAVGREDAGKYELALEDGGALFTYESLASGNVFRGAIIGNKEDLEKIKALVAEGERVRIGRSSSAQYGGWASWHWEGAPVVDGTHSEASGWTVDSFTEDDDIEAGTSFQVTLLSPMLSRNTNGHPAARFPIEDLARELGGVQLTIVKSFTRTGTQGGYLSHQRLPREQVPALLPGSVFVIESGGNIPAALLNSVAGRSWGMRTEDGFGRIAISAMPGVNPSIGAAARPNVTVSPFAPGDATKPQYQLAVALFQRRVSERAVLEALKHAGGKFDATTNHLLARLASLVKATPKLHDLPARLDKLRKPARSKLGGLDKLIRDASGENWEARYQAFAAAEMGAAQVAGADPTRWARLFGANGPALAPDEEVVRNYLLRLLAGVARARRKAK
jgi:CRISPR-associated protein Csx10